MRNAQLPAHSRDPLQESSPALLVTAASDESDNILTVSEQSVEDAYAQEPCSSGEQDLHAAPSPRPPREQAPPATEPGAAFADVPSGTSGLGASTACAPSVVPTPSALRCRGRPSPGAGRRCVIAPYPMMAKNPARKTVPGISSYHCWSSSRRVRRRNVWNSQNRTPTSPRTAGTEPSSSHAGFTRVPIWGGMVCAVPEFSSQSQLLTAVVRPFPTLYAVCGCS